MLIPALQSPFQRVKTSVGNRLFRRLMHFKTGGKGSQSQTQVQGK